eukprot:CAMPEP_0201586174 /NCGR_PEP_ID=MMETSP0190_2-20130828/129857_1 /ASSEMBLY_ACC=CAM_ASM_000263 /TAXON_ID=37353 /ORGANISM="Rosalina sp." /LENGTH=41 /DNA_ID= /DNA_START= /DNA_END= /DNA_ORIENTATION=
MTATKPNFHADAPHVTFVPNKHTPLSIDDVPVSAPVQSLFV